MKKAIEESVVGKYCLIRGNSSGVMCGVVTEIDGTNVLLTNARKVWYWHGAKAVEQLAVSGCDDMSHITVSVAEMIVTDAVQVIPMTDRARKTVEEAREWKWKA